MASEARLREAGWDARMAQPPNLPSLTPKETEAPGAALSPSEYDEGLPRSIPPLGTEIEPGRAEQRLSGG